MQAIKFKVNLGYSLVSGANGIDVKWSDTSLSSSSLGLRVSTTYKSELQQIKTDTETFKTQAQTQSQEQMQQRLQQKQQKRKH